MDASVIFFWWWVFNDGFANVIVWDFLVESWRCNNSIRWQRLGRPELALKSKRQNWAEVMLKPSAKVKIQVPILFSNSEKRILAMRSQRIGPIQETSKNTLFLWLYKDTCSLVNQNASQKDKNEWHLSPAIFLGQFTKLSGKRKSSTQSYRKHLEYQERLEKFIYLYYF